MSTDIADVTLAEETTIARMSVGHRVVRILIAVWLLVTVVAGASLMLTEGGEEAPNAAVVIGVAAVVSWLLIAMIGRNFHAFAVRPVLTLSPHGIHLHRLWKTGPISWVAPFHRPYDRLISWDQYAGCEVYSQSVNGIRMYQELVLKLADRTELRLPGRLFSAAPPVLQLTILDYLEREFRQKARLEAGLADFQRRRWAEPRVFTYWTPPFWLPVLCLLLAIGVPLAIPESVGKDGHALAWVLAVALGGILTIYFGRRWFRTRHLGRIELRGDGVMICRRDETAPVIPWENLLCRPHTIAYSSGGRPGAPRTVKLELRDGSHDPIYVWPARRLKLDYLFLLLSPPLDGVRAARERMARGEAVEDAARASGLVGRD